MTNTEGSFPVDYLVYHIKLQPGPTKLSDDLSAIAADIAAMRREISQRKPTQEQVAQTIWESLHPDMKKECPWADDLRGPNDEARRLCLVQAAAILALFANPRKAKNPSDGDEFGAPAQD